MDPMTGLFLVYLLAVGCCIAVAWGITKATFGTARWIKAQLWPTEQAKADLHHSYRKGER